MMPPSYSYSGPYANDKDFIYYFIRVAILCGKTVLNDYTNFSSEIPITLNLFYKWKISTVDGFESIETEM